MHCFKRLQRTVAWLLLCCVAMSLFLMPVSAENTETKSPEGRQVSVVRYRGYSGSLVIGCLDNGTKVTVLDENDAFYKIDCYDMVGYIAKTQVAREEDGSYYVCCIAGSVETKYLSTTSAENVLNLRSQVKAAGLSMCGVPYVLGGYSRWGIDCSGLTRYAYSKAGMTLDWIAQSQLADGVIVAKEDMQVGDLIFFEKTTDNGRVATHVGIYIGNGQMVHAGASTGVVVSDLSIGYYEEHYLCARRVILADTTSQTTSLPVNTTQDINSSYWRENSQTQEESGNFSL